MESGYFYWMFDTMGWKTWFCGACKKWVHHDDVHVRLGWKYCPYCGDKKIKPYSVEFTKETLKELPAEDQRWADPSMYK